MSTVSSMPTALAPSSSLSTPLGPAWQPGAASPTLGGGEGAAAADADVAWLDPFAAGAFDTLHVSPGGGPRKPEEIEQGFLAALGLGPR